MKIEGFGIPIYDRRDDESLEDLNKKQKALTERLINNSSNPLDFQMIKEELTRNKDEFDSIKTKKTEIAIRLIKRINKN